MTDAQSIREKIQQLSALANEARLTAQLATDEAAKSKYGEQADEYDRLIREAEALLESPNR